jgi:hypothetical protein
LVSAVWREFEKPVIVGRVKVAEVINGNKVGLGFVSAYKLKCSRERKAKRSP